MMTEYLLRESQLYLYRKKSLRYRGVILTIAGQGFITWTVLNKKK